MQYVSHIDGKSRFFQEVEEAKYAIYTGNTVLAHITVENRPGVPFYPAITRISFEEWFDDSEKPEIIGEFLDWFVENRVAILYVEPKRWYGWKKLLRLLGFKAFTARSGCLAKQKKGVDAYFYTL